MSGYDAGEALRAGLREQLDQLVATASERIDRLILGDEAYDYSQRIAAEVHRIEHQLELDAYRAAVRLSQRNREESSVIHLPPHLAQWWGYFQAAGKLHGVDPYLLAAICDRESRGGDALSPRGPAGTGDEGNGCGLMQIDRRFHGDFISRAGPTGKPLWCLPDWNIAYAASLLADDLHAFGGDEVRAVAAYNAGRAHVTRACAHLTRPLIPEAVLAAADSVTTGGDYASDVLARRLKFTPPKET